MRLTFSSTLLHIAEKESVDVGNIFECALRPEFEALTSKRFSAGKGESVSVSAEFLQYGGQMLIKLASFKTQEL